MGPLDLKGLLGAATVMGTLMYGAGHVWAGALLPQTFTLPEPGCLQAELGAHQEHVVDHDAQAADRKRVSADVIHVASYEVATDSDKDESITANSDSEESDSASESALFIDL